MNNRSLQGFTLSELLVSLAVLGLIAAFAIPKVLTAVGQSSSKAIGRELFGLIAESYDAVKANNVGNVPRSTSSAQLVGNLNYARQVTTAGNGGATTNHVVFQNGSVLAYVPTDTFADSGTVGRVGFTIDPDGPGATSANGPVTIYLGGDGRIWAALETYTSGTGTTASPFNTDARYTETALVTATVASSTTATNADTTWFS